MMIVEVTDRYGYKMVKTEEDMRVLNATLADWMAYHLKNGAHLIEVVGEVVKLAYVA